MFLNDFQYEDEDDAGWMKKLKQRIEKDPEKIKRKEEKRAKEEDKRRLKEEVSSGRSNSVKYKLELILIARMKLFTIYH